MKRKTICIFLIVMMLLELGGCDGSGKTDKSNHFYKLSENISELEQSGFVVFESDGNEINRELFDQFLWKMDRKEPTHLDIISYADGNRRICKCLDYDGEKVLVKIDSSEDVNPSDSNNDEGYYSELKYEQIDDTTRKYYLCKEGSNQTLAIAYCVDKIGMIEQRLNGYNPQKAVEGIALNNYDKDELYQLLTKKEILYRCAHDGEYAKVIASVIEAAPADLVLSKLKRYVLNLENKKHTEGIVFVYDDFVSYEDYFSKNHFYKFKSYLQDKDEMGIRLQFDDHKIMKIDGSILMFYPSPSAEFLTWDRNYLYFVEEGCKIVRMDFDYSTTVIADFTGYGTIDIEANAQIYDDCNFFFVVRRDHSSEVFRCYLPTGKVEKIISVEDAVHFRFYQAIEANKICFATATKEYDERLQFALKTGEFEEELAKHPELEIVDEYECVLGNPILFLICEKYQIPYSTIYNYDFKNDVLTSKQRTIEDFWESQSHLGNPK